MKTQHFETLSQAVQYAVDEYKGIILLDSLLFEDYGFMPMAYETNQTRKLPGTRMVNPRKGRAAFLVVEIYRFHSGRYEVNAYCT
jgi:hypothetical protein